MSEISRTGQLPVINIIFCVFLSCKNIAQSRVNKLQKRDQDVLLVYRSIYDTIKDIDEMIQNIYYEFKDSTRSYDALYQTWSCYKC